MRTELPVSKFSSRSVLSMSVAPRFGMNLSLCTAHHASRLAASTAQTCVSSGQLSRTLSAFLGVLPTDLLRAPRGFFKSTLLSAMLRLRAPHRCMAMETAVARRTLAILALHCTEARAHVAWLRIDFNVLAWIWLETMHAPAHNWLRSVVQPPKLELFVKDFEQHSARAAFRNVVLLHSAASIVSSIASQDLGQQDS